LNLIISEINDVTTDLVAQWLLSNDITFDRLNNEVTSPSFSYMISNSENKVKMSGKEPSRIWHRRGKLNILLPIKDEFPEIYNYLKRESDSVIKSVELNLKKDIDYVGSFLKETENYKLTQLEKAKQAGFRIPNTIVTTSKKDLLCFFNKNNKVITKDIRYPANVNLGKKNIESVGTILVTDAKIHALKESFAPILMQEYIEKEYEIRIFFFKSNIYAMAIFSQNNEQTQIDFRNYDENKPNRCIPISIPKEIEKKIFQLSKFLELNSGSIDLIYTRNDEYLFLEVNPQGQLDWLSRNCNYYIEKDIATFFN